MMTNNEQKPKRLGDELRTMIGKAELLPDKALTYFVPDAEAFAGVVRLGNLTDAFEDNHPEATNYPVVVTIIGNGHGVWERAEEYTDKLRSQVRWLDTKLTDVYREKLRNNG